MRAVRAADVGFEQVGSMRDGILDQKHLLIGEEGSPCNYDLNMGLTGGGGWRTPRHRHNFDQYRYVLKGDYPYEDQKVLPEGWVGYFPEDVRYGPQDRPAGLETVVLQFGGASGNGYLSVAAREAANDALKAKGEFSNGQFHYVDENGEKQSMDGSAACFEEATGRKLQMGPGRYECAIAINPEAFAWSPTTEAGVDEKWLGSFTERGSRAGFVRIAQGSVWSASGFEAIAILFVTKGTVEVDGQTYDRCSAFEILPDDAPVSFKGTQDSEILIFTLHKF